MKSIHVSYLYLAVIAMLLYNTFLIQRDTQLFKSYENIQSETSGKLDNKFDIKRN